MNFRPQNTQSAENLGAHWTGAFRELSCMSTLCIPCNLWSKKMRGIGPQNTQSAQNLSGRGLGRMYQLFGDEMDVLIEELNGELTA